MPVVFANLTTGKLTTSLTGGDFTLPPLKFGDDLSLSLRWAERDGDTTVQVLRTVHALKVALGTVDKRPVSGTTKVKIGSGSTSAANTTPSITWPINAETLQSELNALSDLSSNHVSVTEANGSLFVIFTDGAQHPISLVENNLLPRSDFPPRTYQRGDGKWVHEIRFTQLPCAFTDGHDAILPPPPVITEVTAGGSNEFTKWNAVQKLFVPPTFQGTYVIVDSDDKQSLVIDSTTDGDAEIATKIAGLADVGAELKVVQLVDNAVSIEFTGTMGGSVVPLLTVRVVDPPVGDETFVLSLRTRELWDQLRLATNADLGVKLQLEIEATFADPAHDGEEIVQTICRMEVTVVADVITASLAVPPRIDWLKQLTPVSYDEADPRNVIVTTQHDARFIGDGILSEFDVTHGLNTLDVLPPLLYEVDSGRILSLGNAADLASGGADFVCDILNDHQIKITLATGVVPATNALRLVISTAGPVSSFLNDLVINTSQVTGLDALLAAQGTAIAELQAIVGVTGGGSTVGLAATDSIFTVDLRKLSRVYPWRGTQPEFADFKGLLDAITKDNLRPLGLLAAVSTDTITPLTVPVPAPSSSDVDKVFQNQTSDPVSVQFPGLGHGSFTLQPDEFALSDGRLWGKARRFGSENTWYPQDFEQRLFAIPIDGEDHTVGRILSVDFAIQLGTINANTALQWALEIRWAALTADAFTTGVGPNLNAVAWNATPLVSKRIIVTDDPATHTYGLRINRTGVSTWVGTAIVGGTSKAANGINTANYVLGAFMCRADTEDAQSDPRGFLGLVFPSPTNAVTNPGGQLGQLTIK